MTLKVRSQCSTKDENFNSPDGGPFFSSEEVVPLEMLVDMIVLNLSSRTLTNYDSSVTNSCLMIDLTVNIKQQMEVMLISLAEVWDQFISIMVSFGQETSIEVLRQCCGSEDLTIQALVFLPDPLFALCT